MRTHAVRTSLILVSAAFLVLAAVPLSPAEDLGWPREVRTSDAVIVIYQPQPESLEGNILKARTAVSVARGGATPVFGAVWGTSTLDIDRDARMVSAVAMTVDRVRFPDVEESRQGELRALLEREFADLDLSMSLDRLMTGLEAAERERKGQDLRNSPPRILFSSRPALLVSIDGQPELRPIGETPLMRVINTPFPIVFDPDARSYYLYGSSVWFSTSDLVKGEWRAVDDPPARVAALFKDDERAEGAPTQPAAGEGVPPETLRRARIIVATEPSELIVAEGEPRWSPVVGSELLALSNSESTIFLESAAKRYYVVLSGRWYRAPALEGPWTHIPPPDLPEVFARIRPDSRWAAVRPHVPGTEEAEDAVADAMIPQTAAVSRRDAQVEVAYDGAPKFDRIPGTRILLAVNTASQVLKVHGRYWLCEQGVWYVSDSPEGPWEVADERPDGVDDIPSSSSAYNVKYVYIYDSTPDYVYVGYLPGYTGCYPYYGTVVYGTGWYYPAWVSPYYYYPRSWTWGFHVGYNPWYGWGYGASWGLGWASFSWNWGYGWGGWYHGYYPIAPPSYWHGYYPRAYPYGYAAGWNAGYWSGMHAGGFFGPGGYSPYYSARRPRPPAAAPAGKAIGRLPRSAGYNLYARAENPNVAALKPARTRPIAADPATMGGPPGRRGATATRPPAEVRAPTDTRPPTETRPPSETRPPTAKRPEPGKPARPGTATTPRPDPGTSARPEPGKKPRPDPGSGGRVTPKPKNAPNNVYVDPNGDVYRYNNSRWERRQLGRWQPTEGNPAARAQGSAGAGRPAADVPRQRGGTDTGARRDGSADRPGPRPAPRPAPAQQPAPSAQAPRPAQPPQGSVDRPPQGQPPRPPASGGYGNRAVPRGGSSLDSARGARERGSARINQYRGGSQGSGARPSGGSRKPSGGSKKPSGGSRPNR